MTVAAPAIPIGDIDTPRPIHASGGAVSVEGWCLLPGHSAPPVVRMRGKSFVVVQTERFRRQDVPVAYPNEPAAAECGFRISGPFLAGVHLVLLEAEAEGEWKLLRSLCVVVEQPAARAGIDAPTEPTVSRRTHVEGWILPTASAVAALTLRYGHQEISCDLLAPRSDLAGAFPGIPAARGIGFKSRTILGAGFGPLRLRACLTGGGEAIVPTALRVEIPVDENVGADIDLGGKRTSLPRLGGTSLLAPLRTPGAANVLFVLFGSFTSNSALHVSALANELADSGHECAVAVSHDVETFAYLAAPHFRPLTFGEAAEGVRFADGRGPQIIHAWTTRENVRKLSLSLRARHGARLIAHLEDNEIELLASHLRRDARELAALPAETLDTLIPEALSHPVRSRDFLAGADGVTIITEALGSFVPDGIPHVVLTPAADRRYFLSYPPPRDFRRALLRHPDESIIAYHGNVHATNAAEMRELYLAVLQLNDRGEHVTLLRTGRDTVDFLGDLAVPSAPHVIALGEIGHHQHLPPLLALADFFVQPGWDDDFNRYRFPSKLPEFFSLGRPVVLPRTNLGLRVRHGIDALVLERADASGIVAAVTALRHDADLRQRLTDGALAFARTHFDWRRTAETLANFYRQVSA